MENKFLQNITPKRNCIWHENLIAARNGSIILADEEEFLKSPQEAAQIKISEKLAHKEELCTRRFL